MQHLIKLGIQASGPPSDRDRREAALGTPYRVLLVLLGGIVWLVSWLWAGYWFELLPEVVFLVAMPIIGGGLGYVLLRVVRWPLRRAAIAVTAENLVEAGGNPLSDRRQWESYLRNGRSFLSSARHFDIPDQVLNRAVETLRGLRDSDERTSAVQRVVAPIVAGVFCGDFPRRDLTLSTRANWIGGRGREIVVSAVVPLVAAVIPLVVALMESGG